MVLDLTVRKGYKGKDFMKSIHANTQLASIQVTDNKTLCRYQTQV